MSNIAHRIDGGEGGETLRHTDTICAFTRQEARQNVEFSRLYDGFLKLRTQFVREKGWLDLETNEGTDSDRYDEVDTTQYVVVIDEAGEVSAGLRLTPISRVNNSLSREMWSKPVARQSPDTIRGLQAHAELLADIDAEAAQGNVWDLTRLVTRGSLESYNDSIRERYRSYKDVLRMWGASIAVTGRDTFWIYTASTEMQEFMRLSHAPNTVLTSDFISPGDETLSYLAVTPVRHAFEVMRSENPKGTTLLNQGYAKIAGSKPD